MFLSLYHWKALPEYTKGVFQLMVLEFLGLEIQQLFVHYGTGQTSTH